MESTEPNSFSMAASSAPEGGAKSCCNSGGDGGDDGSDHAGCVVFVYTELLLVCLYHHMCMYHHVPWEG